MRPVGLKGNNPDFSGEIVVEKCADVGIVLGTTPTSLWMEDSP
jgi:hypothetical protein